MATGYTDAYRRIELLQNTIEEEIIFAEDEDAGYDGLDTNKELVDIGVVDGYYPEECMLVNYQAGREVDIDIKMGLDSPQGRVKDTQEKEVLVKSLVPREEVYVYQVYIEESKYNYKTDYSVYGSGYGKELQGKPVFDSSYELPPMVAVTDSWNPRKDTVFHQLVEGYNNQHGELLLAVKSHSESRQVGSLSGRESEKSMMSLDVDPRAVKHCNDYSEVLVKDDWYKEIAEQEGYWSQQLSYGEVPVDIGTINERSTCRDRMQSGIVTASYQV